MKTLGLVLGGLVVAGIAGAVFLASEEGKSDNCWSFASDIDRWGKSSGYTVLVFDSDGQYIQALGSSLGHTLLALKDGASEFRSMQDDDWEGREQGAPLPWSGLPIDSQATALFRNWCETQSTVNPRIQRSA